MKLVDNNSLYNKILYLHRQIAGITSNETLDAFDLDACSVLDRLGKTDSYIARKLKCILKELNAIRAVDYDSHIRTAYEAYNEIITYKLFLDKCVKIKGIRESDSSTPDFELEFSILSNDNHEIFHTIHIEVKSLGFADGNLNYITCQKDALNCQIKLEDQFKKGIRVCMAERSVAPLGHVGFTEEMHKMIDKIENNIKSSQFAYGEGNRTILFVDLNQLGFISNDEECLAIYPDIIHSCCITGKLWMISFGHKGERIYVQQEFEGKSTFGENFLKEGILNVHSEIMGIIFGTGREMANKKIYGFFRHQDMDLPTSQFILKYCDFWNDDENSNGYMCNVYKNDIMPYCIGKTTE